MVVFAIIYEMEKQLSFCVHFQQIVQLLERRKIHQQMSARLLKRAVGRDFGAMYHLPLGISFHNVVDHSLASQKR